jgi:hypothetical protein
MTYVILRHHLAAIIGRMVHHFQQVRERSHYSEVVALDDELLRFVTRLPPHFAFQPDQSLDETSNYIPVHRFLLVTEILFVRISLHRPYLLRRLKSDRYARSRAACFDSAKKDFEVRQAFREVMPKEARESLSNAYREFQTAMISGIYLVLDPRGKDASAMHAILDGFMKDHKGMREMDETTRRELKTIEFLKTKASQVDSQNDNSRQSPLVDRDRITTSAEHQPYQPIGPQQILPASSPTKPLPSHLTIPEQLSPRSSFSYVKTGHLVQSPTFQRLQQGSQGDYASSPSGSGSPNAEDESSAQSLLDHWCNTVSNAPIDAASGGMIWGGPGGADFAGWVGNTKPMGGADSRLPVTGMDGSDWNYWEALVNQIQGGP